MDLDLSELWSRKWQTARSQSTDVQQLSLGPGHIKIAIVRHLIFRAHANTTPVARWLQIRIFFERARAWSCLILGRKMEEAALISCGYFPNSDCSNMKLFWTHKILPRWWRRGTPSTLAQVIRCKTITWVSSSDVFLGPIEWVGWNTSKEHVWMVDDKWSVYNFYILIRTYCTDFHINHAICYVYFRYYRFWVYIDYSFHNLCQAGVPTSVTVPVWASESRFLKFSGRRL